MLVLTRKVGETFLIGKDIRITVCKVENNAVRIGIDAPQEIQVIREEVADKYPQESKS